MPRTRHYKRADDQPQSRSPLGCDLTNGPHYVPELTSIDLERIECVELLHASLYDLDFVGVLDRLTDGERGLRPAPVKHESETHVLRLKRNPSCLPPETR